MEERWPPLKNKFSVRVYFLASGRRLIYSRFFLVTVWLSKAAMLRSSPTALVRTKCLLCDRTKLPKFGRLGTIREAPTHICLRQHSRNVHMFSQFRTGIIRFCLLYPLRQCWSAHFVFLWTAEQLHRENGHLGFLNSLGKHHVVSISLWIQQEPLSQMINHSLWGSTPLTG